MLYVQNNDADGDYIVLPPELAKIDETFGLQTILGSSSKTDPVSVLVILYIGCHQPLQAVLVRMRQCVIVIATCGWHKGSSVRVIDVKDALYERVELP